MHKTWIGAHTSAAGGAPNALYQGQEIGATTVQLFTSNQKQWNGRKIEPDEIDRWKKALEETGIEQVMSHDSYLINLGSCDEELLAKSRRAFRSEIERCFSLGIPYLNFHPGTATRASEQECLETIVNSLLTFEPLFASSNLRLLLETTAGQGTSVGYTFEHLAYIIQRVEKKIPIGVCIDTCHIFAAGYDLRTKEDCQNTLQLFDQVIGIPHLYALHLNDSLKDCGSKVDRHAPLGKGKIGIDCFKFLMISPLTRHLPKYLETPNGPSLWTQEIACLKQFVKEV